MYCVVVESLNNVSGHFAFSLETYKHVQHKKWPMHNYEVVILTLKYHIWEKRWQGLFDWRRSTSTFYIFIPGGFWKCGIDTFPSIEVILSLLIIITIVFLATFTCTDSHFPLYLVLHCVFERSTCSPVSQTLFRWKVNLTISHLRLSPRLI